MNNFVIYKSSAGSGKTFTLVKEYLKLSLTDPKKLNVNYKRILAVTFTNKAAAEMKQRILNALNEISNNTNLPFIGEELLKELNIQPLELKQRSKILLSQILHHYSDFSIGTIDSFTHKIVKTFAFDLKLPVNFNLEMDVENFYNKVIATLISQIGEDDYTNKLLKEFVLIKAEENTSWDPEKKIKEFSKLLQKENSNEYLIKLKKLSKEDLETVRKDLFVFINSYTTFLKTEANKALHLIDSNNLNNNDFNYKTSGPQNFFKKCSNNTVSINDIQDSSRIIEAVEKNKWSGNSDKKNIVEKISTSLSEIAKTLIDFIKQQHGYYNLCKILSNQIYPLLLLKKIEEISDEKKQEERLVFISEFNKNIFNLINNEPTPFIYERLGEKYRHYLLDEFQDTSSLQWHNILPLIDNSLSNGWYNLIVGDGKQSIYRWRNANVNQFVNLPQIENTENNFILNERRDNLVRNFKENLLNTNYRSLKTIIDFNNDFFDKLSDELLSNSHKKIYENQKQEIKNEGVGLVTFHTGKVNIEELESLNFKLILEHIENALKSDFDYKDICIIVRRNTEGNNIASFLMNCKIPIVSSDSLLLKNNIEINTIVSYLKYLSNQEDKISATAILNYLLQTKQITNNNFTEGAIKLTTNKSLSEILNDYHIVLPSENLSLNNIFDHCLTIINSLSLNINGYPYIRFFLDEVNEYLVTKDSNISAFCEWWETRSKKASLIIPENTNAVKIMTIHASKGLEFPVVIIPFCNGKYFRANDNWITLKNEQIKLPVAAISITNNIKNAGLEEEFIAEEQEQILDNLNLLYVAFTRAVERLHVISAFSQNNKTLISNWIEKYLNNNLTSKSSNYFEIGKANNKQIHHTNTTLNSFKLNPLKFNPQPNVIKIKASHLLNSQDSINAKENGIIIHWILSKIKNYLEINEGIQLAIINGIIAHDNIIQIKEKIENLINHPDLTAYFSPGKIYKIESEIATVNGEILRPDRIIIEENITTIIDYKTGKVNNEKYFKQLKQYQDALYGIGYKKVKSMLVYIDKVEVFTLN